MPGTVPAKTKQFAAAKFVATTRWTRPADTISQPIIVLRQRRWAGTLSFSRFLSTYHTYYKADQLRKTVFAGNLTVGLAKLYSLRDRNGNGRIDDFDQLLPISERFLLWRLDDLTRIWIRRSRAAPGHRSAGDFS